MSKKYLFAVGLIATSFSSISSSALATTGNPVKRICGRYSTVILNPDESATVDGAGLNSVSLLINGKAGTWLFYDGLVPTGEAIAGDTLVLKNPTYNAYRRSHDARIYSVQPKPAKMVDGKQVNVGVMGVNMMRQAFPIPAIKGTAADIAILKRVLPGQISKCDLRWVPGKGLVK